jgi:hypothetical protein
MNITADVLSRYPYIQESTESTDEANEIWIDIGEDGQIQGEWELEDIPMNTSNSFQPDIHDEEVLNTSVISMDISILDSVHAAYKDDKFFDPIIIYPE